MEMNHHHYVNCEDVANRDLPDLPTTHDIMAKNELLSSLQKDKQTIKINKQDATGDKSNASTIKNTNKSKSLSHIMVNAFAKKFTIRETQSFVAQPVMTSVSSSPSNATTSRDQSGASSGENESKAKGKTMPKITANKKKGNNMLNDKKAKYAVFRNPKIILRDVKNSVAHKFKSKHHASAEFEKFENEVSTPASAKLYSPFGVFTDSVKTQFNSRLDGSLSTQNDLNLTPRSKLSPSKKNRVKHLRQKLIFDSPTGKFRESVGDVEKFQQDIHRINAHICASQQQSSTINFQLHE